MTTARTLVLLAALALIPLLGTGAGAAIGNAHRPSALPWSDVVRIPAFDPAHGELTGVRLTIETFASMGLRAENLSSQAQWVSANAAAIVDVRVAGGHAIAEVPYDASLVWTLAPFDGALDYGGVSGRTATSSGRRTIEVLVTDPAILAAFVGEKGVGGTVAFPVTAVGTTEILGDRDLAQLASIEAGVRVRATYLLGGAE